MNKILFINACLRDESRTLMLAKNILEKTNGIIKTINLYEEDIKPLSKENLSLRDKAAASNDFSDNYFRYAKEFKDADEIIIAAPFWDLSFPAVLKIFFENICIVGLTFIYNSDGKPVGLCKAKRLTYIATAGGYIPDINFAFDYVDALAKEFFDIKETIFIKAEGLDIDSSKAESIVNDVIKSLK